MTPALLSDYFSLQLESDKPALKDIWCPVGTATHNGMASQRTSRKQDREEKYITSGVTWQAYESLLSALGNSSSYRIAYFSETLEIMSPTSSNPKQMPRLPYC